MNTKRSFGLELTHVLACVLSVACASESKGADETIAALGNSQSVDVTADASAHHCHAAFDEPQSCDSSFSRATACKTGTSDTPLLSPGLQAVEDEGCYYFCPDVPDCSSLTLDEVAELACKYAASNGFHPALGLATMCGPVANNLGSCCFGLAAVTYYN